MEEPENEENKDEQKLVEAETRAAEAVAHYRRLVAASGDLVPDLVQGSTIEEVDASVEKAREAYKEISRQIAARYERDVPAGNPARSAGTFGAEALSPEAKIALGLRGNK